MANRYTLHITHLPKLKMWLVDQGWELQPLTDHGYEVLRAKRDHESWLEQYQRANDAEKRVEELRAEVSNLYKRLAENKDINVPNEEGADDADHIE